MYFYERIVTGLIVAAVCGIVAGIYYLAQWLFGFHI